MAEETKKAGEATATKEPKKAKGDYEYFKVAIKFIRKVLATGSETGIYYEHVLKKAKKEITKANKLHARLTKHVDKYAGQEIPEKKEKKELLGILRTYCELIGVKVEVTEEDSIEKLLEVSTYLKEEYEDRILKHEQKATIFMRDSTGKAMLSTHMLIGNFKANLRVMVDGGDTSIMKYKTSVSSFISLDVKPVEEFFELSHDLVRDGEGERVLYERPIRFDIKGVQTTAIAQSEYLPEDTIATCTLRVRRGSPLNIRALKRLLTLGKNQGIGANRGAGNYGAYKFKIESLPEYKEPKDKDGFQ